MRTSERNFAFAPMTGAEIRAKLILAGDFAVVLEIPGEIDSSPSRRISMGRLIA